MSASLTLGSTRRPLFMPGVWRRMGARLLPLLAFYIVAVPAGTFRGYADDIGLPVREHFSTAEAFFLSAAPSEWLQALFLDVRLFQYATLVIYASWFTLPILAGLPLLLFRPEQYWKLAAFLLLTYYAGMPFFALYPIEPPWLHDGGVARVLAILIPDTVGKDTNPYAAMPSLHIALPAAAAFWYGWSSGWGRLLWGYTALLTLAIVYSGDHYPADAAAGVLLAWAVHQGALRLRLPLLDEERSAPGRPLLASRLAASTAAIPRR